MSAVPPPPGIPRMSHASKVAAGGVGGNVQPARRISRVMGQEAPSAKLNGPDLHYSYMLPSQPADRHVRSWEVLERKVRMVSFTSQLLIIYLSLPH